MKSPVKKQFRLLSLPQEHARPESFLCAAPKVPHNQKENCNNYGSVYFKLCLCFRKRRSLSYPTVFISYVA